MIIRLLILASILLGVTPVYAQHTNHLTYKGVNFIIKHEGMRRDVYRDIAGYLTVGVGHLVLPSDNLVEGQIISEDRVHYLLLKDTYEASRAVDNCVTAPLSRNQYDALVSFVYNVGVGAFCGSTLVKKLNQENYASVPTQLLRWVHAGGKKSKGLVNRRNYEINLFIKGEY
jgi:lysozyme